MGQRTKTDQWPCCRRRPGTTIWDEGGFWVSNVDSGRGSRWMALSIVLIIGLFAYWATRDHEA
jgi:hypothetical protein